MRIIVKTGTVSRVIATTQIRTIPQFRSSGQLKRGYPKVQHLSCHYKSSEAMLKETLSVMSNIVQALLMRQAEPPSRGLVCWDRGIREFFSGPWEHGPSTKPLQLSICLAVQHEITVPQCICWTPKPSDTCSSSRHWRTRLSAVVRFNTWFCDS